MLCRAMISPVPALISTSTPIACSMQPQRKMVRNYCYTFHVLYLKLGRANLIAYNTDIIAYGLRGRAMESPPLAAQVAQK